MGFATPNPFSGEGCGITEQTHLTTATIAAPYAAAQAPAWDRLHAYWAGHWQRHDIKTDC
jgi:hypothetical protein